MWKSRRPEMFSNPDYCKTWNTRHAGEIVGSINKDGYIGVYLYGRALLAHRIIFSLVTNREPMIVDHINGIRTDNSWINLREVDASGNARNRRIGRNNTSGHFGVTKSRHSNKWQAQIRAGEKFVYLGRFESLEDAAKASSEARKRMGYHENHGTAPVEHDHANRLLVIRRRKNEIETNHNFGGLIE